MLTIQIRRLDRIRLFHSYGGIAGMNEYLSIFAASNSNCVMLGLSKQSGKHLTSFIKPQGEGFNSTSVAVKFFPVNSEYGQAGIAIEITPSKLSEEQWKDLRLLLDTLFSAGSQKVCQSFRLTKIEIAIDVKVPFDEVICIAPGISIENLNYLAKGTRYLGQKGGKKTFCIYDKRKQLADKLEVDLGHDMTRIEVRLRHLGKKVDQVSEIKNPFGNFVAIRKASLQRLCLKYQKDSVLHEFSEKVLSGQSAHAAYWAFPKHKKKHLLDRLRPSSLNLNGREAHWQQWIDRQQDKILNGFGIVVDCK